MTKALSTDIGAPGKKIDKVPEQLALTSYVPYAATSFTTRAISPNVLSIWANCQWPSYVRRAVPTNDSRTPGPSPRTPETRMP